jgi:hypothetical protein
MGIVVMKLKDKEFLTYIRHSENKCTIKQRGGEVKN